MSHDRLFLLRRRTSCKSFDVCRSYRRGHFESLNLPFLLLQPFRCQDRTKRHYNLFFTGVLHEPEQRARRRA